MLLTEANVTANAINGTIRREGGVKDRAIIWKDGAYTVNPPNTPIQPEEVFAFNWKVYGADGKEVPYTPPSVLRPAVATMSAKLAAQPK